MNSSAGPSSSEHLAFLDVLLRQDEAGAAALIDRCLASGMNPTDISLQILTPALTELGELWAGGKINIAEEHWATEATARLLGRLRNAMPLRPALGVKAVVSSVGGNLHSLGSRMVADALEMDGWAVDFLGSNIPNADLVAYIQHSVPALIALSVSLAEQFETVRETVAALRQVAPSAKIILGGHAFSAAPANIVNDLGADAVAADAKDAAQLARRLMGLDRRIPLESYLTTIGIRVRSLRLERGWGQRELGDAAGLDRAYISSVEHGKQNLTLGAIKRLADALDVSLEDLLLQFDSPNSKPDTSGVRPAARQNGHAVDSRRHF